MKNFFNNRDLRNKIIVLMVCMGIYKLGIHVYVPGINRHALEAMSNQGGVMAMMNTFTGGALQNFSIFAVGIMPYITASIIMQLLQLDVVKILTEWSQEGAVGQKKIKRVTYVLTGIFAVLQSVALSVGFGKMYVGLIENPTVGGYALIALILTLGTAVLVVLGEVIEKRGIGKGISMIILGGILMSLPTTITQLISLKYTGGEGSFISIVVIGLLLLFLVGIVFAVIVVEGATRRIPIQNGGSGGVTAKSSQRMSYLPFKLNSAGVIPVIFASALFMLPATLGQFIQSAKFSSFIDNYLSYNSVLGIVLYALLIVLFTYFYSFIQMDPEKLSDNLKKSGSYVPTIRPGEETTKYLTGVLVRLTMVGSLFLAGLAALPLVLGTVTSLPEGFIFGGTSVIIIVSVCIDFATQVQIQTQEKRYKRFTKTN